MIGTKQLDLFAGGGQPNGKVDVEGLRGRIPPDIRFGALGWSHPQWGTAVWAGPRTAERLEQTGLPEYAAGPRFSSLCIPAGAEPLSARALRRYAGQLPASFGVVVESHAMITAPRLTRAAGSTRGRVKVNPGFLQADAFVSEVWRPAFDCLAERLHWVLLVFPPELRSAGIPPAAFAERLARFLAAVPNPARCAIEVREAEYLTLDYARVLAASGAVHVFSTAPAMPDFATQAQWAPSANEAIFRVADPVHGQYPSSTERRTALVDLIMDHPLRRAVVLVGDDAEGSTPETIDRLLRQTADRFALEPDVALAGLPLR